MNIYKLSSKHLSRLVAINNYSTFLGGNVVSEFWVLIGGTGGRTEVPGW